MVFWCFVGVWLGSSGLEKWHFSNRSLQISRILVLGVAAMAMAERQTGQVAVYRTVNPGLPADDVEALEKLISPQYVRS